MANPPERSPNGDDTSLDNEASIDERIRTLIEKHHIPDFEKMSYELKRDLELKLIAMERSDLYLESDRDMVDTHMSRLWKLLACTFAVYTTNNFPDSNDEFTDFGLWSFFFSEDVKLMGERAKEEARELYNPCLKSSQDIVSDFEGLADLPEEYRYQLLQLVAITFIRWMSGVTTRMSRFYKQEIRNPFPLMEKTARITPVGNSGHLLVRKGFCAGRDEPDNVTVFKSKHLWIAFILDPDLLRVFPSPDTEDEDTEDA